MGQDYHETEVVEAEEARVPLQLRQGTIEITTGQVVEGLQANAVLLRNGDVTGPPFWMEVFLATWRCGGGDLAM